MIFTVLWKFNFWVPGQPTKKYFLKATMDCPWSGPSQTFNLLSFNFFAAEHVGTYVMYSRGTL